MKRENRTDLIPGLIYVMVIAIVAQMIGYLFPIIGAAVTGILLGAFVNHFLGTSTKFSNGIHYTLKTLLKLAIILLGFSFSLTDVLAVGKSSIIIVLVSVITGLISTYYIGRMFGLDNQTALLIGSGTAICGATAIVTISPIIKAKEAQLTYAINTVFLFNILAILTLPFLGSLLELSDHQFGIWAGAAIHDTSSVVAAGYTYSDEAGAVSIVVKLARTLMLIPLVIAIAIMQSVQAKRQAKEERESVNILSALPHFIFIFVAVVLVNSFISLPEIVSTTASAVAKFVIVMVMVSVGLKTDLANIKTVGYRPLLVGLIASLLVGGVSLGLIYCLVS